MSEHFYHSGQAYSAYDKIIDKTESFLNEKINSIYSFSKRILVDRIIQIVVEVSRNSYIEICKNRIDSNLDMIPEETDKLVLKGFVINTVDGQITLANSFLFRSLAIYIYFWMRTFFMNILSLVFFEKNIEQAALFYGLSFKAIKHNNSDERFVEFCRNGPINPLQKFNKLIIQDSTHIESISNSTVLYRRYPVEALLCHTKLSFLERIKLMIMQLQYAILFIITVLRNPVFLVLAKDVAYLPIFIFLDKNKKIESICLTNTSFYYQPVWMRGPESKSYKVHNIHYSQNEKPFVYKEDKLEVDFPAALKIYSDEHWVWTEGRKEQIIKRGHRGKVHVVGPILWYLPEKNFNSENNEDIKIAIFDILPIKPDNRASIGVIRNPYITENLLQFMNDIIEVVENVEKQLNKPIKIIVKQKRAAEDMHDPVYLNYINDLAETNRVEKVSYDLNLFSFLSKCDLSIMIPYTSVAYISSYLNKPAIYYDAKNELYPLFEVANNINFASNIKQLKVLINSLINKENL